jgi:hypothetical protein
MRKFVLAAAIAGSALGLAACSETAVEAEDTVDAMAADVEANTEAAGDAVAEGAADVVEGAEEAAAEAEAAVDAEVAEVE